ncbi:MAG TPA: hypothetical protein VLJ86_04330 [Ramlibacter sp.]|nr:hypothetical protein [Ramlibacter sp.]
MRITTILAALAVTVFVAGCKSAPVLDIAQAPTITASGKALTRDQVRAAIVRSGATLGWLMKDEGPNMIVGTFNYGATSATVEIPYTGNTYSIKYRSSVNLDKGNGLIHKRYNTWIQDLTRGINTQIAAS